MYLLGAFIQRRTFQNFLQGDKRRFTGLRDL